MATGLASTRKAEINFEGRAEKGSFARAAGRFARSEDISALGSGEVCSVDYARVGGALFPGRGSLVCPPVVP